MGNYRQHIAFGSIFGLAYSLAAAVFAGLHWAYATVAILLSTLGGLLPDLDSASGVEMRSFTGILGVLASLLVWRKIEHLHTPPGFEYHLWAMVLAYLFIRHGLRRLMIRVAVHRGMSHSIPTGALWGAATYLAYPSDFHSIRLAMAFAVMLGFLSHLLLDEICSVDLQGVRVNKAFGTALKLWAPSPVSTILVYTVLSLLTWKIVHNWPTDGLNLTTTAPAPAWPYDWPRSWFKNNFAEVRKYAADQFKVLPKEVTQAKDFVAKEFDGLPQDLAKAKDYVIRRMPQAKTALKKAASQADVQVKKIASERIEPKLPVRAKR